MTFDQQRPVFALAGRPPASGAPTRSLSSNHHREGEDRDAVNCERESFHSSPLGCKLPAA